ncbi:MAG: hypothetical protein MI746_13475 [Pseudomonadales bacterium]|nr:hypothetical protein [Pseudomonadales bacterium]
MLREHRGFLIRIIIYMLCLAALMAVVAIDARAGEEKFYEDSYTELAQEAIFLVLALGMFAMSYKLSQANILARMFAGFFLLCFIRELDALLEQNIGTGTWQVLVTLVLLVMVYQARKNWSQLTAEVRIHVGSYSFGLFMAGFLTTFLFSRLIGNEELWMTIMEEGYRRNVKNAVEESVELLGDALILFSGVEFFVHYNAIAEAQSQAS